MDQHLQIADRARKATDSKHGSYYASELHTAWCKKHWAPNNVTQASARRKVVRAKLYSGSSNSPSTNKTTTLYFQMLLESQYWQHFSTAQRDKGSVPATPVCTDQMSGDRVSQSDIIIQQTTSTRIKQREGNMVATWYNKGKGKKGRRKGKEQERARITRSKATAAFKDNMGMAKQADTATREKRKMAATTLRQRL